MKYAWIKEHRNEYDITLMCEILGIGRTSYYDWLKSQPSPRDLENQQLSALIKGIFVESRNTYGTRRIRRMLMRSGINISRRRVGKLMKEQDLCCKTKRKFKATTDSNHSLTISPNILNRDFSATAPNQKYVGDITYIWTLEGWIYLAVLLDVFSRKVVGWSIKKHMRTSLVNEALLMAIANRGVQEGLIYHTDRGSQYASNKHRKILNMYGITQSMSRKGDCWDNSVAESFFNSLKTEMVHHVTFKTRDEAKQAIFEYIEVFYNRKRIHSANDYFSPEEYEQRIVNL